MLTVNPENARDVAVILFDSFNSSEGIFGHNVMPEDLLPVWGSDLTSSGIGVGSYEHLMFNTLVVSIDYQRNADHLWAAGRKTFEDEETRWLFYPGEVVRKSHSEVRDAMMRYGLLKVGTNPKTNLGDVEVWSKVSKSLFEVYDSDPMNLIKECGYDALRIFNKKFDPGFKRLFPYFSGDKIFPLWIRMLRDNLGLELSNIERIPIPVDVHIARATFTTGCLTGVYSGTISQVRSQIDGVWEKGMELVEHTELTYRLQLDEPLWNLSKYGCRFRRGTLCTMKSKCPVGGFCIDGTVSVSGERIQVNAGEVTQMVSLGAWVDGVSEGSSAAIRGVDRGKAAVGFHKTHADMIREAVEELGCATPNQIMDFIGAHYPDVEINKNSFRSDIIGCSVNHTSSHHYPGMPKFLFYDKETKTYKINRSVFYQPTNQHTKNDE